MKTKITVAALRLFLLRGYKYVSLVDVAKELHITKGGIYHYFGSKEELLHAAVDFLFTNLKRKFLALFEDGGAIRDTLRQLIVERLIERYINELLEISEQDAAAMDETFIYEIMQHYPECFARIENDHLEICAAIEKNLRAAMARGEVRDDLDPQPLAWLIWSMLHGQKPTGIVQKDSALRQKIAATMGEMLDRQHS